MDGSYMMEFSGVFLDEAQELLQVMDQEILNLERHGQTDEGIQRLFRAAHTLKGSSAAMGLVEIKQLTHEMEQILDEVRNHRMQITPSLINLLFRCHDQLQLLIDDFNRGDGGSTDIDALVHELQQYAGNPPDAGDQAVSDERPTSGAKPNPDHIQQVQQALQQGMHVYDLEVELAAECPMKAARAMIIHHQLDAWGDVLHVDPAPDQLTEESAAAVTAFRFVIATQAEPSQLKKSLLGTMDVSNVQILTRPVAQPGHDPESLQEQPLKPVKDTGKRMNQTIRVDVERLEMIMNLVGELVIDQTRIHQVGGVLHRRYAADEQVEELDQISDHLSRVVSELQDSVMKVRMLPLEQLFNRYPRMIRDLAKSLGREVDLVIEGQETELDRTVIEEISDPLIHLIRNAVDHGIEPPEERVRIRKTARGLLRITAAHEENQVVITVEDDGNGIDPERMKESALRKGIITAEECENLTDREAMYLIFRPGFSTASAVSDVSGRGVGMDIVRNHIEKLNGIIEIESKLGEGTKFIIKLPLTLAIMTGLLIGLNGTRFVIPLSSVSEIVRLPREAVQTIKNDAVIVIRDRIVPLLSLHDYFHIPGEQDNNKLLQIVIVGSAEKQVALIVDELIGNQEIVVKSLGSYVGKIKGIAGATILGDGRVALIIETADLTAER